MNEYLRTISGQEITAKDFRTWAATNLAYLALHELSEERPTKKGTLQAIKRVAEQLGNTPDCLPQKLHSPCRDGVLFGWFAAAKADERKYRGATRDVERRARSDPIFEGRAPRCKFPPFAGSVPAGFAPRLQNERLASGAPIGSTKILVTCFLKSALR